MSDESQAIRRAVVIGSLFYISETTVKSHLGSVFRKLDVLSRTEAIATASRRGLIEL